MRTSLHRTAPFWVALALPLTAQEGTVTAATFDADRAMLSEEPMFDPFYPMGSRSLQEVLDERLVDDETPLLVLEVGDQTLALLTAQMAYHHVAQGELAGEPWLVTF